jgi:hypothetical protein
VCSQPGRNLFTYGLWKLVPHERWFLYTLFLVLDVNFCIKRKDVSSEANSLSLDNEMVFFSQVDKYMVYLDKYWDVEQEVKSYYSLKQSA